MKKWLLRSSLVISLIITILEIVKISQRFNFSAGGDGVFGWVSLVLFWVLVAFSLGLVALLVWSFLSHNLEQRLQGVVDQPRWYWGIAIFLTLLFVESFQDWLYLLAGLEETFYPIALLENQDLVLWSTLISGQSLLVWLALGLLGGTYKLPSLRTIPVWFLVGFLFCGLIYFSGDVASLPPNAPVPFLQILIITLLVTLVWLLSRWLCRRFPWVTEFLRNDFLALILLWSAAFFLWSRVPLQTNYFIDGPRPPNYQYTPTSDAIYYETQAQSLLAGEGFEPEVQHSLYNYFLSGLHFVGGGHYLDIYRLQILVLALLPFLIYKLAGLLNSRYAGWLIGILVIIREYNALHLGDKITVSNVQELMTEPLATVGVALFLYLTILWIRDPRGKRGRPVLIGTVIGATALIRVELLSLAFVFALTTLIIYRHNYRKWLLPGLLMAGGLIVALTPLVVRNYLETGRVTIDKGVVVTRTIQEISNQAQTATPGLSGTSIRTFGKSLEKLATRMWNRSFTSLEQSLVYLPSNHLPLGGVDNFIQVVPEKEKVYLFRTGLFSDSYLTNYVYSLPYWEVRWEGQLTPRSILPQVLVVTVLLIGIAAAYRKAGWAGLVPLLTMFVHILVYSIARRSGGRYVQVVDWITLLYFILGMTTLIFRVFRVNPVLSWENDVEAQHDGGSASRWRGLSWAGLVFLVILSMPIVEAAIPPRYTEEALDIELGEFITRGYRSEITDFLSYGECLLGKALYPRFFNDGESFGDDRAGSMPDTDRNQMVFNLVGTSNTWVSLPSQEPLSPFPHGSEILVCGKIVRDSPEDLAVKLRPYFRAERIFFLEELD